MIAPLLAAALATSPLPDMQDARAIHPICVVSGDSERVNRELGEALCRELAQAIAQRGHRGVEVLKVGDARSGQPGRLIVGLRAVLGDAQLVMTASAHRVDQPDPRLVPIPPRALPTKGGPAQTAAAARPALAAMVRDLGL